MHSWSKLSPWMMLLSWQFSLHWLSRRPSIKMKTDSIDRSTFLKSFKKNHFKLLISSLKPDESLFFHWKREVYLSKHFTLGLSCSQEMGRVSVGRVCSWKQNFSMHFLDYAYVIWWSSDFSNCCCSPDWPVAINYNGSSAQPHIRAL